MKKKILQLILKRKRLAVTARNEDAKIKQDICTSLRIARESRKVSLRDMADRLGISATCLSNTERYGLGSVKLTEEFINKFFDKLS